MKTTDKFCFTKQEEQFIKIFTLFLDKFLKEHYLEAKKYKISQHRFIKILKFILTKYL